MRFLFNYSTIIYIVNTFVHNISKYFVDYVYNCVYS